MLGSQGTASAAIFSGTEARRLGEEDQRAYLAHVFAKSFTIGCAKDFKLDVGIGAVFAKLHNSCEASDVSLQERRKRQVDVGKVVCGRERNH